MISSSFEFGLTFLSYLLPFLFVLALVVFIHEMGHFLVGRWCGVRVETFSLGFGPRLAKFYDKHGTEWALSAIPLGGYVKFKGDANAASQPDHEGAAAMSAADRVDSFPHQSVAKRAAIVFAGPFANFLLAFVIFASIFMISGRSAIQPIIAEVAPGSVALSSGFKAGDRIVAIDGERMEAFDEVSRKVSVSEGKALAFVIDRDGREVEISAMPAISARKTILGTDRRPVMGFVGSNAPEHQFTRYYGPIDASVTSVREIVFVVDRTFAYVGGLIAGREKADQLSGPMRIGYISGKVAEAGIGPLLILAAILSVSIGLINLMPVPMLDGGHLVFYAVEAIAGRPISQRTQEIGFRVGFAMVIMLMLFSTWNDILHLTGLAF